jgi:hypothetical protein
MSLLEAAAGAHAPAAAWRGPATEPAARISIPRRLPPRPDGQPLRHLSSTSYMRFVSCPEDWRRWYLKRERGPRTGAMVLGSRVDDAVSFYYRHLLDTGEVLELDQVQDWFRDTWRAGSEAEDGDRGRPSCPSRPPLRWASTRCA